MREREIYVESELPSQGQVEVFARACILFAHRHNRIDKLADGSYKIGPMSHFSPPDLLGGQPWGFLYKDTCTVNALLDEARHVPRMQIVRGLVAEDHGSNAGVWRSTYTYRADSDGETIESSQKFTHVARGESGSQGMKNLQDINLDNLHVPNDISERLALDREMQVVTASDFDQVADAVYEKMHQIDGEERVYSETRKGTYVSYFNW